MATVRRLQSGNYQAILMVAGGKRISATGKTKDDALKAVFKLAENPTPSTRSKSPKSKSPTPHNKSRWETLLIDTSTVNALSYLHLLYNLTDGCERKGLNR